MLIGGLPIVVYAALLAALVLLFVRHRGLMRGVRRRVTRTVWCPVHDRKLTASLEEEIWDGRRVDVDQCSFSSPRAGAPRVESTVAPMGDAGMTHRG